MNEIRVLYSDYELRSGVFARCGRGFPFFCGPPADATAAAMPPAARAAMSAAVGFPVFFGGGFGFFGGGFRWPGFLHVVRPVAAAFKTVRVAEVAAALFPGFTLSGWFFNKNAFLVSLTAAQSPLAAASSICSTTAAAASSNVTTGAMAGLGVNRY